MPNRRDIEPMRDILGEGVDVTIVAEKSYDKLHALLIERAGAALEL